MPDDLMVYRYIQNAIIKENPDKPFSEQQARDLAGAFLFSGDEQEAELGRMSGGERGRARLAALLASSKNVLVLDEPTNHLDIPSAERLEDALALEIPATSEQPGRAGGEFDGTLILISHDRAMIDACCDHLIVLDGAGGAQVVEGNYTQWREREQRKAAEREAADAERKRRDDAEAKRRRQSEQKRQKGSASSSGNGAAQPKAGALALISTEKLEAQIESLEGRIRDVDAKLADPDVWSNPRKCDELGKQRQQLVQELEPLEFEWMSRAEG
jgi:ATP-binding cassette subfamily F protein 3